MNLSRRGFLKTLLATTALAPIALAEPAVDPFALIPQLLKHRIEPQNGNYWAVIHQGWSRVLWSEKQNSMSWEPIDPRDVYLDHPLFKGELGRVEGMRILVDEEEAYEMA